MKIFCLLREYKVKWRRMWVRLTLELLHPVLIIRASAIRIDRHFQNVLVTYSHGNLNVHNLDSIRALHMAKESTQYQTMLS